MTTTDPQLLVILAVAGFVLFWLAIMTILGLLSGWFVLARRYPDREDDVMARFRWQSGVMGLGVNMGGILTLTVCRGGLRVAIWWIFGPFERPFYVPWSEVAFEPDTALFLQRLALRFGDPPVGQLKISRDLGERIAEAAGGHWPAAMRAEKPSRGRAATAILMEGAVGAAVVAALLVIVRSAAPSHDAPPVIVAIAAPLVLIGIATLIRLAIRLAQRD